MSVKLTEIADAITATLGAATGISVDHSYNQLTEGIPPGDLPLLQVYWENIDCDADVLTERTTFQAHVRTKTITYHADIHCRQRSKISEDMKKTLEIADAVIDVLETQNVKPYFNQDGIKAFDWRADRVIFDYGGALYMGIRFYITIYVF
jgi:hypothetical protein